jgi:hypothetical protein
LRIEFQRIKKPLAKNEFLPIRNSPILSERYTSSLSFSEEIWNNTALSRTLSNRRGLSIYRILAISLLFSKEISKEDA